MEWMRQVLRQWLRLPDPQQPDLQVLMDRMDSLEQLLMRHLRQPDPLPPESVDEGRLADWPDAHLGAQ